MFTQKSPLTLFVTISIALSLSFPCSSLSASEAEGAVDPVVAAVNDMPIHKSELLSIIELYKQKTRKSSVSEDEKLELLNGIIRRKLILSQNEIDEIRNLPVIQQRLKAMEDQMAIQYYLNEKIGKKLIITNEEVEEYYRNHLDKFIALPKVMASHILLRSQDEAQAVLSKLKEGADFSELAKKYSIDLPMALEGGSMGIIEKGKSLPQIEKILFILDEGEYSDVIKSQYGYHIIRVDKIYTDKHYPIEEVSEKIKAELTKEKEAEAFNEMVGKLDGEKKIEIFKDRL